MALQARNNETEEVRLGLLASRNARQGGGVNLWEGGLYLLIAYSLLWNKRGMADTGSPS